MLVHQLELINAKANAQSALKLPTKLFVVNPKAQTVNELYGTMDPAHVDAVEDLVSQGC